MKTYYRDILSFEEALRFAELRGTLGHNIRDQRLDRGWRIYFSAGPIDVDQAVPMDAPK